MNLNYCYVFKAGVEQKRLLAELFQNYNPLERPTLNDSQSLKVDLGISIQQIVEVVRIVFLRL